MLVFLSFECPPCRSYWTYLRRYGIDESTRWQVRSAGRDEVSYVAAIVAESTPAANRADVISELMRSNLKSRETVDSLLAKIKSTDQKMIREATRNVEADRSIARRLGMGTPFGVLLGPGQHLSVIGSAELMNYHGAR